MANDFNDPFAPDPNLASSALSSFGQAVPRQTVTPGSDSVLDTLDAIPQQPEVTLPDLGDIPNPVGQTEKTDLLSEPMGGQEPTAFQQKKVNWSDGGENLSAPKAYREIKGADFLEVDYEFGKKEGATDKPVRAANVFGRQFTTEELQSDEEGRKLLELMTARRTGEFNKGGTLANFAKGWGNWSKSDIPFYGWMSDIGTSVTEAIDMSKTIRKLQDGEKVSPHEAIAVRRYMLQQEMEGTRTMAYNVGSIVRQAVPFMAEMAATSAVGAAIGSVFPGLGTGIGGVAGAVVGGLKWIFGAGGKASKAGTKYLVGKGVREIAEGVAKGTAFDVAERNLMFSAGKEMFGKGVFQQLRREAAEELGEGATHKAVSDLMRRKLASRIVETSKLGPSDWIAKTMLVEADKANAVGYGAVEALKKEMLKYCKTTVGRGTKVTDALVREGYAEFLKKEGANAPRVLSKFIDDFSAQMIRSADGEAVGTASKMISESMGRVTNGQVTDSYARTITRSILEDSLKNFELRFGKNRLMGNSYRFLDYATKHVARGILQSENALVRGGSPTLAHAGLGSFDSAWDALAEGVARTMIQAPLQAGVQLGVSTPIYLGTQAALGEDVAFRGQLGTQLQALVTGDREKMDNARWIALGNMFAEYWSENAGRGLAPMVGGLAASVARKSPSALVQSIQAGRNALVTPISKATGSYLSNAVEAVFGFKDVRKMSLGRVSEMGVDYMKAVGAKAANKADISRIVEKKTLDGISSAFRSELESKGIRTAQDFITKSVMHVENMTKARAARAYVGYWLMQKGMTPDAVVNAFRQMGKGGGIIEEMGEERFGDFIRGLMHVDDSASDASLLSEERLKNMFGSWVDLNQLATEFLGFAMPGIVRGGTIRLQSWMGRGAMSDVTAASHTAARISNAANSASQPGIAVEGVDAETKERFDEWNTTRVTERDRVLRTEEANSSSVGQKASLLFQTGADGRRGMDTLEADIDAAGGNSKDAAVAGAIADLRNSQSEDDAGDRLNRLAKDVIASAGNDPVRLQAEIKLRGGEAMFGADGVDAIRREWRKIDGNEFSPDDPIESELDTYNDIVRNGPGSVTFDSRTPTSPEEWLDRLVAYTPFASADKSALEEEQTRASGNGKRGTVSLVGESARADLAQAIDTLSLHYGRAQSLVEPRMSFGRRALTRIAGIPAALVTGNLGFATANPAGWAMMDAGVPLKLQQIARNLYFESVKVGFREVEGSLDAEVREKIDKTIAEGGNLAVALQECRVDSKTLEAMEKAGESYRREMLDRAAQEYLSACGVMTIAQADLTEPATRIVEFRHKDENLSRDEIVARYGDEVALAKGEIVQGAVRMAADENVIRYSTYTDSGRSNFTMSVDALRAVHNGTREEVLAAVLSLPAFRGIHGILNLSDNAEHMMETMASDVMSSTVDVSRIAAMDAGSRGEKLTDSQLGEVMQAMRREWGSYGDDANRAAAVRWISQLRLMQEGSLTTFSDPTDAGRTATVRPVSENGRRSWVSRVTDPGTAAVTETTHASFSDAVAHVSGQGFAPVHKQLVVTSLREVVSNDATSMAYFMYGSNRKALREAYLREIGGEDAVDRDRRKERPLNVAEAELPPYVRKTWNMEGSRVVSTEWEFNGPDAAEVAASVFRSEKLENSAEFRKYEGYGEKMLAALGVVRASTYGARAAGMPSDCFVARTDGGFNENALVISPDFKSNGDSEAMLRAALKLAIDTSVTSPDSEASVRREILSKAYEEFMDVKDAILARLQKDSPKKFERLQEVMDRMFPRLNGRVTTDQLAAIVASSVFFTSERGAMGLGNGYFGAPELALVADEFRASPIYGILVSAVDEILGGNGLFTKEASSVGGLARYLESFSADRDELAKARQSSLFTGDSSEKKRNPYISSIVYRNGRLETTGRNPDGSFVPVQRFTGDVRGEYVAEVAKSCHELAAALGAEDGTENYTTAQMFMKLKRSGMFGGETSATAAPAPSIVLTGGDLMANEAGERVARRSSVTQESSTITPEVAGRIAVTLHSVFRASGMDYNTGISVAEQYMRNRGMAEEHVQLVLSKYHETDIVKSELPADDVGENEDEKAAEAVENGEASSADVFNHEKNLEAFANSKDAKTVSEIVKWFFQLEGGDVSALFDRIRRTLAANVIVGVNEYDSELLKDFASKMNPCADPSKATESLAQSEFSVTFKKDKDQLSAYLDDVCGALTSAGALDYALVVSAVRRLPHARRLAMLDMIAQLTPTDACTMERREGEDRSFSVEYDVSVRDHARCLGAMQSMWTTLISSPAIGQSALGFDETLRNVLSLCKALGRKDFDPNAFAGKTGLSSEQLAAVQSALGKTKLAKSPVMKQTERGTFVSINVEESDANVLDVAAASDVNIVDVVSVKKALDNVQALVLANMEALAPAADLLFGPSSDASALLRSKEMVSAVRSDVEKALFSDRKARNPMTKDARKARLSNLFDLANNMTALPVASVGRNGGGQRQFRPVSNFLWQALAEPVGGLLLRNVTEENAARETLRDMAKFKMETDCHVDNGVTLAEMNPKYDATKLHGVVGMPYFMDAYMSGMPRRSSQLNGQAPNAAEAKKSRTVTTLPSQIPAFLRATNSPLFKDVKSDTGSALDILKANGNRWADGSNPICAVKGARDTGGIAIEKRLLAGITQRGIIDQFSRFGEYKNLLFPLFRGDKSSMYALSVPVDVLSAWVTSLGNEVVAGGETSIPLSKAVAAKLRSLMERAKGIDLSKIASLRLNETGFSVADVIGLSDEKFAALPSKSMKAAAIRADFYDVCYGLLSAACGQDKIDAKRVAVMLSVGPIMPMYSGEDPAAGYYRTTVLGGTSAAAMMGGWFIHGCTADAVAAQADNGSAQAQKLHVYNLLDGVDFDKGQAHDYGIGLEGDEESGLGGIQWWRKQMRSQIMVAMKKAGLQVDAKVGLEIPVRTDSMKDEEYQALRDAYEANVAAYRKFKENSTFGLDDLETHKAGAFGSRAGLKLNKDRSLDFMGFRLLDEGGAVSSAVPSWFKVQPELKAGCPIAWAFAAVAAINGKDLSESDVMNADFTWVKPDGAEFKGTLKDSGLLPQDAKLSFRLVQDEGSSVPSAVAMDFFTRQMVAQKVANNSSSSKAEDGHSFATNLTRDVEVDELLIQAFEAVTAGFARLTTGFVDAHASYAMLSIAQLQANLNAFRRLIEKDEELSAAVKAHPNDRDVIDKVFDKAKAFVSKQMIPNYHGNHGVMVASGLKFGPADGKKDTRFNHTGAVERAPGVDDYTADCFRPAFVYGTAEAEAMKTLTGYPLSRSYASGCVNVDQPGFRYGMYADETKLDALANDEWVKRQLPLYESEFSVLRGIYGEKDARRMVVVRAVVTGIRGTKTTVDGKAAIAYDTEVPIRKFDDCFSSYVKGMGNVQRKDFRYDDLFLPGGKFDYAAIECGEKARTGTDGKAHLYVGGSFFAAHRSPSGNIEAFSGLARASAPVTYSRKTLMAGAESKYALDPVTTNSQGSDTDGDSAGIQVFDYTLDDPTAEGWIDPESVGATALRQFSGMVVTAAKPYRHDDEKVYRDPSERISAIVMSLAAGRGWTTKNDYGETVVSPNVLRLIGRRLFEAQIDNYRRSPTRHQGYADFDIARAKEGDTSYSATDVVSGSRVVDVADGRIYDTGFVGRAPVGTDAVHMEPMDRAAFGRIMAAIGSSRLDGAISFDKLAEKADGEPTMLDVLNAAVDAFESGKTDLNNALSAAKMSDAASDSADGRGVSVFLQSRFLRSLAYGVGGKTGADKVTTPARQDGYSPLADLVAHFDNISNNLFDTLKKMFATRAGWTKDLLPVLMARIVRRATERGASVRLDNEFFCVELCRFLVEANDPKSPVARFRRYADPVNGRDEILKDIRAYRDSVKTSNPARYQSVGAMLDKLPASMTALDIADRFFGMTTQRKYDRKDSLFVAATDLETSITGRPATQAERDFAGDTLWSIRESADVYGDLSDFPKVSGYSYKQIDSKAYRMSTEDEISEGPAVSKQSAVSWMFMDWMRKFGENRESVVCAIHERLRRTHREEINNSEYGLRPVSEIGQAYDRMAHFYGAMAMLRVGPSDNVVKLLEAVAGKGGNTEAFLRGVASAVKSEAERVIAAGETGPVADLFRSLVVDRVSINLRANATNAEIGRLREGFLALSSSQNKYKAGTVEIKGSTLAKLIVLHVAATQPFGSLTSFVSQSNVPSVFGDDIIRRMEDGREIIDMSGYGIEKMRSLGYEVDAIRDVWGVAEFLNYPMAKIEEGRTVTSLDVMTIAKGVYESAQKLAASGYKGRDTFVKDLARYLDRPVVDVAELGLGEKFLNRSRIPRVNPRVCRTFDVAYTMPGRNAGGEFRAVDAFGKFLKNETFDSLEEALNRSIELMSDRIVSSATESVLVAQAAPTADRSWLETNRGGRDSWLTSTAKRILRDAAVRNENVYDMLKGAGDRALVKASNPSVEIAYNSVRNRIENDPSFKPDPQLPVPASEISAAENGGTTIDPNSVLRSAYLRSVDSLYPEFDKTARDNMVKAVPEAIEAAFKKAFGESVTVSRVKNNDGEDTNLVKVVRDVQGKSIVTYIAFGESLRRNYPTNDRTVVQSLVQAVNAQRGESAPKLSVDEVMALPENERRLLLDMVSERAAENGRSNEIGHLIPGTSLAFAGAMSGLIRLDVNAKFTTLFHEYFHSMLRCYRRLGIATDADMEQLKAVYHDDAGEFNEEAAADAYASYLTGVANPRLPSLRLRDYDGNVEIFERFRSTAEMIAEATARGIGADGLPVFVRCTMLDGLTADQLAKMKTPDPGMVRNVEAVLLGQTLGDSYVRSAIPVTTTTDQEMAISKAYLSLKRGDVPLADMLRTLRTALEVPTPTVPPIVDAPAPAPVSPVRPSMTAVGKVQAFLATVVNHHADRRGDYADLNDDLIDLMHTEADADLSSKSIAATHVIRNVRRLIREVAAAYGIETERVVDGRIVLTQDGKDLFSSDTVNELALRLMANADFERKSRRTGYELEAQNAGADYAFARALERMDRGSYRDFAIRQAERSRAAFLAAQRAVLRAADENEARGDMAAAARLRKQAQDLASRALIVVEIADKVSRGADLHPYFPRNRNKGNLHGLMFDVFSGGAQVDKTSGSDGISRYKQGTGSGFAFDLSDPLVQTAYDFANMAFFVAEVARSFSGDLKEPHENSAGVGSENARLAPTREEAASAAEALKASLSDHGVPPAEPSSAFPTVEFDLGRNSPTWILESPGSWLASDMQRDFGAVSLREMMTDHSVQAGTENAYALAMIALQVFGSDCFAGDRLRLMELAQSELGRNKKGDFAYVKDGKRFIRFSHPTGIFFGTVNFGAKRVGKAAKSEDLQLCNFVLQAIRHAAAGDSHVLTGIDLGYLANKEDLRRTANDYRPAAVVDRILNEETRTAEEKKPSALDKVLYRILLDLPKDIVGNRMMTDRDARCNVTFSDSLSDDGGIYWKFVNTFVTAAALARSERTDAHRQQVIVETLRNAGLVRQGNGGKRTVVSVDIAKIRDTWDSSAAKRFLNDGGRPMELLDFNYWRSEFARAATKLNSIAAKSAYLRNGAGSTLTTAATPNFWFHGGSGAHMLDVQKYQTALNALKAATPSTEERLRDKCKALFSTLEMIGTGPNGLGQRAFTDEGKSNVSNAQLLYLADLLGVGGAGFDVDRFVEDIVNGEYEDGKKVSGVSLGVRSTKGDIAIAINRIVSEEVMDGLGGSASGATIQDLADMNEVNERLSRAINEQIPGRILAMSDQRMFEKTGQLGTNWTAPEAMMQMCQELVAAERFRSCLAQMLTSVSYDGTPNYVVDPSEFAAQANRMPDEYWGALARTVIDRSSWCRSLPAYDAAKTGVENMHAVFEAIRHEAGSKYGALDVDKFGAYPIFNGILCRKSDVDSAGNVDELTRAWGGEAECYMRQLLGIVRAPSCDSALKQLERIMAWSKLASVGFSAFFQIATAFESQTAASGFTQAFMSNLPGKSGAKLGRVIGRAMGREGGLGAFQADAVTFKDIIDNINSNDPFVVELREMCDLIGMPLDQNIDYAIAHNESNPGLGQSGVVKQDIERVYRWAQRFNVKGAGRLKSFLNFCYQHPTDYTFNVVLNGVKMAVVAQTMRRLREECLAGDRPFDPVKELRRHAAYINAEIGGIDPGRYAWAHPQMQRILRLAMFSWQWTVGAWVAGSGEAISDMLFGGHSTTRASRQYAYIRWLRMLGIVKFGVPFVLQAAVKVLAKAMNKVLPPPDPEDPEADEAAEDERNVPWLMWNNESKVGSLCFDITPLLKMARRIPGAKAIREHRFDPGDRVALGVAGAVVGAGVTRNPLGMAIGGILGNQLVPRVNAMLPVYVGGGRNTTGNRRYYMHFGKQSDEFFRYFDGPTGALKQLLAKGSTGLQTVFQLLFGHTLAVNDVTEDIGKLETFVKMFMPFSLQGTLSNADAGVLAAIGPIKMGESKRSTRMRIVERLNDMIENSPKNDPFAYRRNRRKLNLLCTDILREAQLNGVNPETIVTSALGDVAQVQYLKLMDALPKDAASPNVDVKAATEAVRATTIVNRKLTNIRQSVIRKYEDAGTDPRRNPFFLRALTELIRNTQTKPYGDESEAEKRFNRWFDTTEDQDVYLRSTNMAENAGATFTNFLATDEVPATLFGVPVVTSQYSDADLAFFKSHPEAGGFYDLGDGGDEPPPAEPPPDGNLPPAGPRSADKGGETAEDTAIANANAAIAGVLPFIKEHEGFRPKAYRIKLGTDKKGDPIWDKWTIGYGQTEIMGADGTMRPVTEKDVIDEQTASMFVENRVRENAAKIATSMKWTRGASSNALEALYDLAYNMGVGAIQEKRSPTLNATGRTAVGQKAVDAAIWAQVPTYTKAGGVKVAGLVNRRNDMMKRRTT